MLSLVISWFSLPFVIWIVYSCIVLKKKLIQITGTLITIIVSICVVAYMDRVEQIFGLLFINGAHYAIVPADFDGNRYWKQSLVSSSDGYAELKGILIYYSLIAFAVLIPGLT